MRPRDITIWTLLLALGCSSGSVDVASGGIGGSGISNGPISGFGSIFVTAVEWDLSNATILLDGSPAPGGESDLGLGMVVVVEGNIAFGNTNGAATRVEFDDAIEGPIDAIAANADVTEKELTILGQSVVVSDGGTVFDGTPAGFGFASIMTGDVVEVSGLLDPTGRVRATRIEKKGVFVPGLTEIELHGTVSGFAGGSTFQLSGGVVTIGFDPTGATTDLGDLPGGPANGLFVEVEGVLSAANQVTATRIELEDEGLPDAGTAGIEGFISNFVALSSFEVAGQQVDASNATRTPNDPTLYANGALVAVEGAIIGGVLFAERLELRGFDVRVRAAVASDGDVDPLAGTIVLLGIPVRTDASTLFEDDRDDVPNFSLADLRGGDFLDVRGVVDPAGGMRATRLERRSPDNVELRGFVEAFDGTPGTSTLTILGVVVPTDGNTDFEDENDGSISITEFFNSVQIGDLVSVKDDQDGDQTAIDVADEVEIEKPEGAPTSAPARLTAPLPRAYGDAAERRGAEAAGSAAASRSIGTPVEEELPSIQPTQAGAPAPGPTLAAARATGSARAPKPPDAPDAPDAPDSPDLVETIVGFFARIEEVARQTEKPGAATER